LANPSFHPDIEHYLNDLRDAPAIPTDELSVVLCAAAAGDERARERVVLAHLPLVVKIACQYAGYGLPLGDLIAEGNLGLVRAAALFDPKFGVAFSTYAGVWIKQRMHRAITSQGRVIRIPVWRSQRLRKLDRLHEALSCELGRDADAADLADRVGLSEAEIEVMAADRVTVASLEDPEAAAALALPADSGLPGESLSREELLEELLSTLHGLDDEELQILSYKFGLLHDEPMSYREMAPRFARSREWVRRIGEKALAKAAESFHKAGDLPRWIVRKRRDRIRKRLESLAAKSARKAAPLSLPQIALMQWMEPFIAFL
jgi:RNA polymerase primary sigma factor